MKRWAGALAALGVIALAIAVVQLLPSPGLTGRPDFPAFVMTIEEWDSTRASGSPVVSMGATAVYRLDYRRRDDWTLTLVRDDVMAQVPGQGNACRNGTYGSLDASGRFTATSTEPAMCNGVGRWIHYGIASSYPWKRETADGRVTYTDPGERVVFDLATGLPLLYEAGPVTGPVGHRTIFRVEPPTVVAAPTPTQTASPTTAPTPPRTSRAAWAGETATVADVLARFRSAGLKIESQPPPSLVIFGAERVDQFFIEGEMTAIYTLPTTAASARVYDEAANNRLTVSYLRTPYYVQVANLLVVITTNDPKAAAAMIDAITRST